MKNFLNEGLKESLIEQYGNTLPEFLTRKVSMGTATIKTTTIETFLLELTREEAELLIKILGNIAGDGSNEADFYNVSRNICQALKNAGVEYPKRSIEFRTSDWMSFVTVRG